MKRKLFVIALAATTMLAMSSCKNDKSSKNNGDDEQELVDDEDDDDEDDEEGDLTDAERSDFTFKTELVTGKMFDDDPDDEDTYALNIIVRTDYGKGLEWFADVEPIPLDTRSYTGFGKIEEDDINFDGYPDLQVCLGPFNSYGNFSYAAWVWNQEAHAFNRVEEYEELFDPTLNPVEKTVTGTLREGTTAEITIYKWDDDGNFVKVSNETVDLSDMYEEE